jgi:hypothetical protein
MNTTNKPDHSTNRFLQQLLLEACETVINELQTDPKVEAALDRLLSPHERARWGIKGEVSYYLTCDLKKRIEPRLRQLFLQFVSLDGFNALMDQITQDVLAENLDFERKASQRRREELGLKVVKPEEAE